MSGNVVIGGVMVSPIVVQLFVAIVLTVLISFVLLRLNFYKLVWHRPLVEVAIFCILLGTLVVLMPDDLPLVAPSAAMTSASEPVAR